VAHNFETIEPLVVLDAQVCGDDITVDLYGSPDCVCASVRFTFADASDREQRLEVLHRWRDRGVPLTLVLTQSSVALANSSATAQRACSVI
jgi:hypothetical protein